MKYIIISILLLLSTLICNAQIAPPNQTDTLIITSVKYNYADIHKENWPCDIIYKSMKDILIGEQTFNIVKADKYMETISFVVYEENDSEKKQYKFTLREDHEGKYTISFSGYDFTCYMKGTLKEVEDSLKGFNANELHYAEANAKLPGRRVDGILPSPTSEVGVDGKVVVKIWVSQYGEVEKAQAGIEGTTATDKTLWQAAYKAAMGAHFNMDANASLLQEGTITYIFD